MKNIIFNSMGTTRLKKKLLFVLAAVLVAGQAYGFSFSLYNFGSNPFDNNNNWSPVNYPHGIGHNPSGGEDYDLEGLKVAVDEKYVYVALTNSFGYTAPPHGYPQGFDLGDIFIGTGGANKYGFAIRTTKDGALGLYKVNKWDGIPKISGGYYNDNSIRNQVGAWKYKSGSKLGNVTTATKKWTKYEDGKSDTYVMEYRFDKSLLGDFSKLELHNTLACGNDLMNTTYEAVPEPATIALLGLGLAGAGIIRRRKKN